MVIISLNFLHSIKLWDYKTMDTSEADSDQSADVVIAPLAEYSLTDNVGIRALVDSGRVKNARYFIMLDTLGRFLRLTLNFVEGLGEGLAEVMKSLSTAHIGGGDIIPEIGILAEYHAGAITGLGMSPVGHLAATCGADGFIKCWDYVRKELVDSLANSAAATCLQWSPLSVDPTGGSFAVGFSDGVVRCFCLDGRTLRLAKAYKPHNAAVTDVGFSSSQKLLFTSGKDGIVFAFRCSAPHDWQPIVFVTVTPSTKEIYCERFTTHASSSQVACCCSDGVLREVDFQDFIGVAAPGNSDDLNSFERSFPVKEYFVHIVEKVTPAPQLEGATTQEIEAVPAVEEAEREFSIPRIGCAAYSFSSEVAEIIVGTDVEHSQLFVCGMESPIPKQRLLLGNYSTDGRNEDKPPVVTSVAYSHSGELFLTGASDGSISIRRVDSMKTYLRIQSHNAATGGVRCMASSFDDKFVLSAGLDGALIVHRLEVSMLTEASKVLVASLELNAFEGSDVKPSTTISSAIPNYVAVVSSDVSYSSTFSSVSPYHFPAASGFNIQAPERVVDIEGGAYSIQDAKLKYELDAKRVLAEQQKTKVRAAVKELRKEYAVIQKMNAALPEQVRLKSPEMEVDSAYIKYLDDEGERLVQEVHKESAYELEKSEALCRKLKSRLMANMLLEEMPLKSLDPKNRRVVYSLRVRGVEGRVQDLLDAVEAQVKVDQLEDAKKGAAKAAQKKAAKTLDDMQKRVTKKDSTFTSSGKDEKHSFTSAAVRRDFRRQRLDAIEKHSLEKPSKEDDDVQDIEAIQRAQQALGDYKLKSSDDYEVPADQRINAQQKKRQLALLEESTMSMRMRFNERFLSMRQLKRQMILNICKDNARIRCINEELREPELSTKLWEPSFDPMEYPDDRYEVTAAELEEYRASRQGASWAVAKAPMNQTATGSKTKIQCDSLSGKWSVVIENPSSVEGGCLEEEDDLDTDVFASNNTVLSNFITTKSVAETKRLNSLEALIPCLRLAKACQRSLSWMEQEEDALVRQQQDRKRSLIFERTKLTEKTAEDIASFDNALDDLRLDRHTIVSDLKLAELKLLVLFQEFELLLTFEGKDISLQQKLLTCQRDKAENIANIDEHQSKLSIKMEDLKQWTEKIHRLHVEYKEQILDSNPYAETLGKIFRKKIKRAKVNDNEESEDDYEDDDDDDYDEDEEEVEDICPPGCELQFYESVLELRRRRLDAEDSMGEVQKRIDDLKRTIDRFRQRERQIDKDLKQTEAEIQQFQQQKQVSLNKIDIVVPLHISQLYAFENSGVLSGPKEIDMGRFAREEVFDHSNLFSSQDVFDEEGKSGSETRTLVASMSMQSHVLIRCQ